jgi:hypothetical protein
MIEAGLFGASMYLPRGSRAARGLRGAAGLLESGLNLPSTLPSAVASGVGSLGQSALEYALEDPERPSAPRAPEPAPSAPAAPAGPAAPAQTQAAAPAEPSLEEQYERDRAAREAASYRSPIRAVRLPNGRVVFTNLESWEKTAPERLRPGSAEIPYGEAVGREREEALDPRRTPTGSALTGILRAQVRAAQQRAERERANQVEAAEPEEPSGAVSFVEGTPEIQDRLAIEGMARKIALAQAGQELERALMPPAQAAALANPEILRTMWLMRFVAPQVQAIRQAAAQQVQEIERSVADPKERARQILAVQTEEENAVDALNAIMATGARQRIPQ